MDDKDPNNLAACLRSFDCVKRGYANESGHPSMMKYDYRGYAFGLQHLVFASLGVCCGLGMATYLISVLEQFGGYWPTLGFLGGFLFGLSATLSAAYLLTYWYTKRLVAFPVCRNGACRVFDRDYTYPEGTLFGWIGIGRCHYKCKCDDEYLRYGMRFLIIERDGTMHQYKMLDRHGNWIDDDGPEIEQYQIL